MAGPEGTAGVCFSHSAKLIAVQGKTRMKLMLCSLQLIPHQMTVMLLHFQALNLHAGNSTNTVPHPLVPKYCPEIILFLLYSILFSPQHLIQHVCTLLKLLILATALTSKSTKVGEIIAGELAAACPGDGGITSSH